MQEHPQSVSLRAATPADNDFLLAVFAGTRSDELAGLAWDPKQSQDFIRMQFSAQQQHYSDSYPAAENNIILDADRRIGRMLVERSADAFLLVDIAVLPEHRNTGIGTALLRGLLSEAAGAAKPVRLHVLSYNRAVRLYERLGFTRVADDGVYLEMKWSG